MQQHSWYFVFQNSKAIIVYKHASLHINTISSLVASVAFRYSWNSQIIMTGKNNNSFNIRQLVIFHNANRKSYRQIAAMLNLSKSTVGGIIKRFKQEDRIESIPQKGQTRKLDVTDQRKITRKIKAFIKCCKTSWRTFDRDRRRYIPKKYAEHWKKVVTTEELLKKSHL